MKRYRRERKEIRGALGRTSRMEGRSKRRMGDQIARLIDDDEVAVDEDENVKFWRIGSKK